MSIICLYVAIMSNPTNSEADSPKIKQDISLKVYKEGKYQTCVFEVRSASAQTTSINAGFESRGMLKRAGKQGVLSFCDQSLLCR
jgi:hypothetical protein